MTWEELKIATLQKMFAITGDAIIEDSGTLPYLSAMPQVANEAMQLLSTAGKFIIKSYDITQDGTGTGFVRKYDLESLTTDFYSFGNNKVCLTTSDSYGATNDYGIEGKSKIVLPTESIGTWTIYYNAYPQTITKLTDDATVLALDPEVASLIPLYMASQLFKDDDISLSTTWRNEFEVGLERLNKNAQGSPVEIVSKFKGW